jgi:HEXXH motif-containing protein
MSLRHHQVSRKMLEALASGGGSLDAVRDLAAAQYSKHMILLRGVLAAAQAAGHQQAPLACRGYDLLAAVQRQAPAAADVVIRHPSVGAWALRTVRAFHGGQAMSGAEPGGLSAVAAAAAIRARLPVEIEVPITGGVVMLPSLGAAAMRGGSAVVRSAASGAEVVSPNGRVEVPRDPHRDAPGWSGLRRVRAGSHGLLIDDVDPFRMPAAANLAPRLPAVDISKWDAVLRDAWALLERHHRAIAGEVAAATTVIVPLAMSPHGQISSSSPEAFGAIALSQPPDSCIFAVTLAHEVQHLKLSALLDIVTLVLPDNGRRFYAPWRDDPRPINGLLQGAYAYLGVSGFWRRQRRLENAAAGIRAHVEFARWRIAAMNVAATLRSSGQLTPAGLTFVQAMAQTLSTWQDEPVPEEAQVLARQEAVHHLTRWRSNNGPVPA